MKKLMSLLLVAASPLAIAHGDHSASGHLPHLEPVALLGLAAAAVLVLRALRADAAKRNADEQRD